MIAQHDGQPDSDGLARAQLMGGGKGRPKTEPVVLSRAPCGSAASTPTAQHDGSPEFDRQWENP